jgi:hypothetical protein
MHELALKQIGRYLEQTPDRGMVMNPSSDMCKIDAYPDADFAGMYGHEEHTDPACTKSRIGFIIIFADCPVFWQYKLQTETALSTMEAKIIALSACCRELFPIMGMVSSVTKSVQPALRGHVGNLAINPLSSLTTDLIDVTDDENFHQVLTLKVMISNVDTSLNEHIRLRNIAPIDPQTLAARWMISPNLAKRTVVMTTQRGVRTCLNPTLSRCFPTNDQMLRYKRLPHTMFTDSTASRQGNKMAQIYSTSFGWARAHPMKCKGEAHETLSLMFHRDGVPPTMVTDGLKEQTLGDFQRKLQEADCHLRVTEPYSPWQQAAEGCIHEIKRGSSRKMISTGSPKPLWDHCLELEALVRSCTGMLYQVIGTWIYSWF